MAFLKWLIKLEKLETAVLRLAHIYFGIALKLDINVLAATCSNNFESPAISV